MRHDDRISMLGRLLESNESRLDALDRRGRHVIVDPPAVLEFLFDRTLAHRTGRELRRNWAENVASLLNLAETEASAAHGLGDVTAR